LIDHLPQLAAGCDFLLLKNPATQGRLTSAENVREIVVNAAANGPATMWWLSQVIDFSQVDLFHAFPDIPDVPVARSAAREQTVRIRGPRMLPGIHALARAV
jgi:hypothetical protein